MSPYFGIIENMSTSVSLTGGKGHEGSASGGGERMPQAASACRFLGASPWTQNIGHGRR